MNPLPEKVSLVMRSYNEAWAIASTLQGIATQDYSGTIELIVIDSGSSDGSHAIIESFQPQQFIVLEPGSYIPGKVLNQGFQLASHDWVVFLNSDATPANSSWLSELLQLAVDTPELGAAFSRQIPRADCAAVFAHDYDRCFGPQRESSQWEHFFSMVSCVARRATGREYPLREDLQYAEDDEWTRRLKAAGKAVPLAERSCVIHSHNYTPAQSYQRAKGDALAVALAGNIPDLARAWHRDVLLPTLKDCLRDWRYCWHQRALAQFPHACRIRYQQRLGRMHGYDQGCHQR